MTPISRQAKLVYDYILEQSVDGLTPSLREIGKAVGMKSTSTVHRYIGELVEAGLIERFDYFKRGIRLVGRNAIKVPLLGVVTAGTPITAIEEVVDYISFDSERYYPDSLFALKIRGDSMINAGIFENDIVIVRKTPTARNGEIVVALVNDEEATVKRYYKENGHYRLQPENDDYEPIIVDQMQILGIVIASMRYYE